MDQPVTSTFELWTSTAQTAALVLIVLSSVYYLFYIMVVSMIKNRSKRYKFVQNRETSVMWQAAIGYALAIALVFNAFLLNERDLTHMFILSIKSLMPIAVAVIFAYIVRTYLNVYYPFILEKRLADIRFRERKNPKTGNKMNLLNEEEEDKYLSEEMIRQEEEFRFDFDVWLDAKTGEALIETYRGSTNKICGKCSFRTLKLVKEEVDEDTGSNVLFYECSHCGNKEREYEV